MSACVAFRNLSAQLKFDIPSITSLVAILGFVHSVFSYSILGILNRSALAIAEISWKFPNLCWKFLLYAGIIYFMLSMASPAIMPKIVLA